LTTLRQALFSRNQLPFEDHYYLLTTIMLKFSSFVTTLLAAAGCVASPISHVSRGDLSAADFVLSPNGSLSRRATVNYDQDYTTGGAVTFSPSGSYYHVAWQVASSEDFVVGVGWTTGSTRQVIYCLDLLTIANAVICSAINFSGSFGAGSGTALLSVYGWSTSPLVEYYIVEDSLNPPSFGTVKGSVYSDGSEYTIYENTRVNEPSIVGTATFNQYISVRSSKRASGTVTVANHFAAWKSLGLSLGTLNYQVVAMEGWGGSGVASQTVSN
jgi:endo-1,4-beta-xylanase